MALSQIQCLDDSHVNWRSSESKPEFFYSEGQRLALEALVSKGPDAFYEILKKENIRDFLSELELKKILDTLETYDPGSDYFSQGDKDREVHGQGSEKGPVPSLEYWPEKSDRSFPQLDLGWPETIAYRGVTRATVYMQPPIDFQPHIKEVVRKMISQAQKVVAVVMDMFTDVDIFKDLLDAGFKRKVAIYIIVDESNLKYFLQMCERAQMHVGHLKNLRVRTTGGTEFFTRSSTHFKGALAQKFMFVDGDKAICGSYSFTWSAARTDRNVISVLSGQVVEAFDKQFQELYLVSQGVSLKSVPMDEEPEPEPMTLLSIAPANQDNAAVKKMVNPKYALVKAKSAELLGNSKTSSQQNSTGQPKVMAKVKAMAEGYVLERPSSPPIHPGLLNLEKANMFDYLPTWVEPDPEPGSEVLGYINIIDPKVKIIQPSQMNRIKVCDISRANAQRRLQQKAQEAKRSHRQPADPAAPHQREQPSPLVQNQHTAPDLVTTANEQTGGRPAKGESLAPLANNQCLGQPLDAQPHGQSDKGVVPPVPKPREVPVTDVLSIKAEQIKGGDATMGEKMAQPSTAGGSTTTMRNKESQPVPEAGGGQVDESPETLMNGVEAGEEEEAEEENYLTVSDQESFSGSSANHSHRCSDASSLSEECFEARGQPALLRRTNSDFLLNGASDGPRHWSHLQRKLSEPHMSRGTFISPLGSPQVMLSLALAGEQQRRRKSDGVEEIRCVLGTGRNLFAFPDGSGACPSDALQGSPLFCYGTKVPISTGRGTQPGKSPEYGKGHRDGNRAKNSPPNPAGPAFWQSKTFSPNKNSQPGHFSQGRSGGPSRTAGPTHSPRQESHKAPEEIKTPLGIPLSKLSQSKHLKNKVGQWADSRRKHPRSVSRKDQ